MILPDLPSEFAKALFDSAPDAILVVKRGIIVLVNSEAERLLGGTFETIVGSSIERFVPQRYGNHGDVRAAFEKDPRRRMMGDLRQQLCLSRLDGSEVAVEIALSPVRAADELFTIAVIRDVTERRRFEDQLRYLSTRDPLTGLYNRRFFEEEFARASQGRRFPLGLVVVDLNRLKLVNDTQGHGQGDLLIQRAARVLQQSFRADDIVARIGGDEFAVLVVDGDVTSDGWLIARLASAIDADNQANPPVVMSLAIGTRAVLPGDSLHVALAEADAQMYSDKRSSHPKLTIPPSQP